MIEKWYRGHSRQQHALDNFGIIWLTDDPYYAQVYAEEDGVVSVIYIDGSKVNDAPVWEDIDFDQYFPDEESIEEYKQEGYNGYYFMASYDYEDFQCLALFDKSPVVKVEEYKGEIEENMKLNYNDIRYIIKESTRRVLNEMYGSKQIKEDFSIEIYELNVAPELEDELDSFKGEPYEVHVICTFECFDGQKGSYEQEPIEPYCTLDDVVAGQNDHLRNGMSPELYNALVNSAIEYTWAHQEEFEMEVCEDNQPNEMDFFDEDEYRYKKYGF